MKQRSVLANKKILMPVFVLAIVAMFSSCASGLKPLASSYFKSTPQPLEAVAGKVPVTINATFPERWFNKNASVTIIPVLRYDGGEAWGTTYNFQGEKVAGNGQVISQSAGANVTMTSSFNFVPAMAKSELLLTFVATVGNRAVNLPDVKIGDGVLATSVLANATFESPAIAADAFQRIIKEKYEADIMFLIQQAELRSSELKKDEIDEWKGIVENVSMTPDQNVNVEISAYASPDGGFELNDKLAAEREKNTNQYLKKELKRLDVNAPVSARYTAQDWEGFRQLVEKSNIQDKDIILRVLASYEDLEERERQIRNISSVFSVLADEILPQLRRSRLTANVEIIGRSDAEISKLAVSLPHALSVEELLYAATLVTTNDVKAAIYNTVTQIYPNDYRAYNNLGVLAFERGNFVDAEKYFNMAQSLAGGKSPEVNYNFALLALKVGDKESAQQFLGNAAGVPELNNALGLLALQSGDFSKAAGLFSGAESNNAALAQIMTKNYSGAMNTLGAIQNPNATTFYLKAIVGARTNNVNGVVSNLQEAISRDGSMASRAINDLEFAKYIANPQFLKVVK